MRFRKIGDDLFVASVYPRHSVNVYWSGGILFDAGVRPASRRLLRALEQFDLVLHALTHVHPDHQGASHDVCSVRGVPLVCGAADADAMEQGHGNVEPRRFKAWMRSVQGQWLGPPYPVAQRLRDGDKIGAFRVIATPGHTPGHVAYWREADRVLICGDIATNMNLFTTTPGLRLPPEFLTADAARNRDSLRRVARLRPRIVCFGHGPVLHDGSEFVRFCERVS